MVNAYPDNADPALSLGLLLAELGRIDEAAEQLLRAAALRPDAARIHFNLGLVLQQLGRLDQATAPLSRAAELAPDDPSTLHALADNLARRGRLATSARRRTQDLVRANTRTTRPAPPCCGPSGADQAVSDRGTKRRLEIGVQPPDRRSASISRTRSA
jgi:Flp pilus assembly protein TadD